VRILRRTAVALLVLGPPIGAGAQATLRLDFVHTGGPGVEVYAVDRLVVEPLPWPGHPQRTLDNTNLGPWRFEVRDESGNLRFSRGFASIYGEWVTTEEATRVHRSFHESLRFPLPDSPVTVSVQRRDAAQRFVEVWRTRVDPADPFIQRADPPQLPLQAIERHGEPRDKVDLLLLGDGYTATECATKFTADARRLSEALFAVEPYASRRGDFNVWGLCPPAIASGVARPSTGVQRNSPAGTSYDAFGSERYLLSFENRALRVLAAQAPYEALVILANSDTYGGGGIFGLYATVAVDNDWADYLFVHEFGHHFAALADEYYTSPVAYQPVDKVVEPWEPNVTALLEPERLKWRDLVSAGTALPTDWPKQAFEERERDFQARRARLRSERRPEREMSALFREQQAFVTPLLNSGPHAGKVGAFRGANYDAQAYYRPQADCIMFTRNRVPFCAVCSRTLATLIDLYAGPPAD
jgi:hypothetical protein